MINALTFDVEDWFCASNLDDVVRRSDWAGCEPRILHTTQRILALLRRHSVNATFFVLGWVAERYPGLVREMYDDGHEVATHGYSHRLLTAMSPGTFGEDLDRAISITEDIIQDRVIGFRAPSFTILPSTLWALDILKDRGILYDSSVFPFGMHPSYGMPGASLAIYRHRNALLEVPLSCAEIGGQRVPCAGGAYFRFLPYPIMRSLFDRCHKQGRPVIFYLHPWEIDPEQPRVHLSPLRSVRQYYNLEKTFSKLEQLLHDYQFTSLRKLIGI